MIFKNGAYILNEGNAALKGVKIGSWRAKTILNIAMDCIREKFDWSDKILFLSV